MFGNYSKMIGSVVGFLMGVAVSYGLPAELADPEIQIGLTAVATGVVTYLFPANKKTA